MYSRNRIYSLILTLLIFISFGVSAQAAITLSAEQGYKVSANYAENKQFLVKVYIDNPNDRIKGMSMVVDYAASNGLDYEMYAVGTRNPDGSEAKADKWTTIYSLEKTPTRHQWNVGYVANTPLDARGRYSFLEMYFSLKTDHRFKAGDVINFTVRNIEIISESGVKLSGTTQFPVSITFSSGNGGGDDNPGDGDFKISGEQGYKIGSDITKNPEFMIKYFVQDLKKPMRQMEMNIEYSMDQPLAFELYACGTRFPNGGEAKDNWWTFLDFPEKSTNRHRAHMLFKVGQGDLVQPGNRFNFLQHYFRFTRGGVFKSGDVITIKISNVKVTIDGESGVVSIPDFVVYIKIDDSTTDVNDIVNQALSIGLSPNPTTDKLNVVFEAKSVNTKISIADISGNVIAELFNGLASEGENQFTFDVSRLNAGAYFLILDNGPIRQVTPLHISR